MDIISRDSFLSAQRALIERQQMYPLNYHEFLITLTKKFDEIKRLEAELKEAQQELSKEVLYFKKIGTSYQFKDYTRTY